MLRSMMLVGAAALAIAAAPPKKKPAPNDAIAESKPGEWREIATDDLLVIDLKPGKRVFIQLAPDFAPVHVANIKAMARSDYWKPAAVYRVQDNYVTQWGNGDTEVRAPEAVVAKPPAEYRRALKGLRIKPLGSPDAYAPATGFVGGWPVAYSPKAGWASLTHCYGAVGVARGIEDVGTGSELYTIIGHAPRQLDRNIAIVGRVIEGIEHLNTLPRGTEALGFYKDKAQYVPIARIGMAGDLPAAERPRFEYMDSHSASFARYLRLRGHRDDDFYRTPALGVDLCNVQVPIRRKS